MGQCILLLRVLRSVLSTHNPHPKTTLTSTRLPTITLHNCFHIFITQQECLNISFYRTWVHVHSLISLNYSCYAVLGTLLFICCMGRGGSILELILQRQRYGSLILCLTMELPKKFLYASIECSIILLYIFRNMHLSVWPTMGEAVQKLLLNGQSKDHQTRDAASSHPNPKQGQGLAVPGQWDVQECGCFTSNGKREYEQLYSQLTTGKQQTQETFVL